MQDEAEPVADARDLPELSFGENLDIRRRLRSGAEVSEQERAAYANRRKNATAAGARLKASLCPDPSSPMGAMLREWDEDQQVLDSMKPKLSATFDNRTARDARRDPIFREYARRLRSPKTAAPPRVARRARVARPRERRAAASSSSSSQDPGDSSDPPPPAPVVPTLAPPPRAIYSYGFAPEGSR